MLISLVGPNLFAKQRELHKLVGSTETKRINGEDGLGVWYQHLGQSDLFGQSPAIIAGRMFEDLSKQDQEELARYLEAQGAITSEQEVIFLINDEKVLAKGQLGQTLKRHKVLTFPKPEPAKLVLWVQQEAERLGVSISKPLIPVLITKLGADQFALQTELERWSLHNPPEITSQNMASIASLETDSDTFGLTSAWEQKNKAKTLDALVALRLQGIADQMIVGMLGWKIESLLLKSGKNQRSGKWTYPEISAAMQSLFKFDLAVKQGKLDPEVGLELWLIESIGS